MLVKSFLAWMDRAPVRERAEAVAMLARAYLARALGGDTIDDVEAALTSILDDPSPTVRRALAVAFADRLDAPRHLVLSLADDQPEVSALLIARSPLLTEADLVDLAHRGERFALIAIAFRPDVTRRVAQALIGRKERDSTFALVGNAASEIGESDLLGATASFGEFPRMREALLARSDLPGSVRHALMLRVADSLGEFVTTGGFISPGRNARMIDETVQGGTISIARRAGDDLPPFVAHLRERGHLTPALLLRSVLGGDLSFMVAALANLCDMAPRRVAALLAARSDAPISALIRRAGIPGFLEATLTAAIRAAAMTPGGNETGSMSLAVIRAAQSACLPQQGDEAVRLIALLRRYEAEAARSSSRRLAESLRHAAHAPQNQISLLPMDIGPEMLRLSDGGETTVKSPAAPATMIPAAPAAKRQIPERSGRPWGLVLDEPIPDLKTLIAEWKAERAMAEGSAYLRLSLAAGNQNENPRQLSPQEPSLARNARRG